MRPHEIVGNPKFFVDGFSRFDVKQGNLGNCWFMAAVANLTQNPNLFAQVVPSDNSDFEENYTGSFHFKFWQYGNWVDVKIDDRLPTKYGRLCFMHSSEKNEFWGALLEKAYAKFYGSYELLKGGFTSEAMVDFSGGIIECYYLKNSIPSNFFRLIQKALQDNAMIGASIGSKNRESIPSNGLVSSHAYSLTKCIEIKVGNGQNKIKLMRLRNPWGNEKEWKGAFSDRYAFLLIKVLYIKFNQHVELITCKISSAND